VKIKVQLRAVKHTGFARRGREMIGPRDHRYLPLADGHGESGSGALNRLGKDRSAEALRPLPGRRWRSPKFAQSAVLDHDVVLSPAGSNRGRPGIRPARASCGRQRPQARQRQARRRRSHPD
jgi:hypothetical protein